MQELEVVQIHSQSQRVEQLRQGGFVHGRKAGDRCHFAGGLIGALQRFGFVHGGHAAFHRVHQILGDFLHIRIGEDTLQHIDPGIGHQGPGCAGQQLDALGTGVGPLVELTGQCFHGQNAVRTLRQGERLVIGHVHRGIGKHHAPGLLEYVRLDVVHIVAVEDPNAGKGVDAQERPKIGKNGGGLRTEAGLLLGIDSVNHS